MKMQKRKNKIVVLLIVSIIATCLPVIGVASTTSAEQQFRELYLRLLETGDSSVQDISDLDLPYMTCYYIMDDVKWNEGFVPYQCYTQYNLIEIDKIETRGNTPYLMQFHLSQNDSGFEKRYASVKQLIAEVQKSLDEKMTDLDKLLWFHEYVVEHLSYKNTGATAEHLGGSSLVQGYGVCQGYAKALMIFLKAENIPCEIVAGGSHEWVAVKIDGQWYHVDPTWDDTVAGSVGTHYFLMRNDEEFLNTLTRKHDQWGARGTFVDNTTKVSSIATDYMDWYVHKVWNRMYYYDGYWYYIMDNSVRKNNIQGTKESVIYEGKILKIIGIENGELLITSEGEEKRLNLKKESISVTASPTATEVTTKEPSTPEVTTKEPSTPKVTTKEPSTPEVTTKEPSTPEATTKEPATPVATTEAPTETEKTEPTQNPVVETVAPTNKDEVRNEQKDSQNANDKNKKPDKPKIQSITNKKGKKIKVVLKKKVAGAKGYEIAYCENKKFKKSVKKIRFTGSTKTIGKLKKNKTYYVKVRAYKKDASGKKIYSSYSSVCKVKITK